ncbi:stoned B-like protein [Schistosoma japonicum]|nr:stoned B-like protein [Schistosoma japonicum]
MSFKFNPISFINRRSSKAKAKARSGSADQASLSQNESDNEFQSPVVRSRIRPSKKISSGQDVKSFPSSSIRAQVLASLRRTRSPKRKSHQQTTRAISVPPSTVENNPTTQKASIITSSINNNHKPTNVVSLEYVEQPEQCGSPAPLAQDDCFELTDISDVENDPMHKCQTLHKPITSKNSITTMDDSESNTPTEFQSQSIENINVELNDNYHDITNKSDQNVTSSYVYDSTDLQYESENDHSMGDESVDDVSDNNYDDDKSVTKLVVEYEIEYPVIDHSDSDVMSFTSEIPKKLSISSDSEVAEHDMAERDDEITKSIQSSTDRSLTSIKHFEEEEEDSDEENIQVDTNVVYQDDINTQHYMYIHEEDNYNRYSDGESQRPIVITDENNAQNAQEHDEELQEQENVDHYESKNDDPSQDSFSFLKSTTLNPNRDDINDINRTYLTTPSIIITCASTESLMKINDDHRLIPPTRPPGPPPIPPPPHTDSTPKRPSPPSTLLPKESPPRPQGPQPITTSQGDTGKRRRKKDKLFGLVNLGPLPSDPDPNFPFRSHFEKSVLPNPKKAIQRILRGETKAERRQRKEQQELNRLLKGPINKAEQIIKLEPLPHSKDWQEFQQLQARIQSTVEESTSKIKALSSVFISCDNQPLDEQTTVDVKAELDSAENWANFNQVITTEEEEKENWANFNQPIVELYNKDNFNSLDTDKNWANFEKQEDLDLDKSNLENWANFEQIETTTDFIIDINQSQQSENWATFDQQQTSTQPIDPVPVESVSENWADFDILQTVNNYPLDTSTGNEGWANFDLITIDNNKPPTNTRDIFNENTSNCSEPNHTDNLFNNCEHIITPSENLFERYQEKSGENEFHGEHHEILDENLFDSHCIIDTTHLQDFNQTESNLLNFSYTDTSITGSTTEDITNNYNNLKDIDNLFIRKKSLDKVDNHYIVTIDNLLDSDQTEYFGRTVESDLTKEADIGERSDEIGYSVIQIPSDLNQTESSDNYFVVDRSGTTENLFGCDYPLQPLASLYSQSIIGTNREEIVDSRHLVNSLKTSENIFYCDKSQVAIKQNLSKNLSSSKDNQQLIQGKRLTTISDFSKPHTLQINFKNMESDKLQKFSKPADSETIQFNTIADISEQHYHNDSDVEHGNYEQNDDFDPKITADSSSDTSSYEDHGQPSALEDQDEVEDTEEEERRTGVRNNTIQEYDSEYHQNYENNDYTNEEELIFTTNVPNYEQNKEEINPFSKDAFEDLSVTTTAVELKGKLTPFEHKINIDELKNIARPRVKPVRQETLSGNNPFRKRSERDEPDKKNFPLITDTVDIPADDLTRIATGIKLIGPQNKINLHNKIKNSFDSGSFDEDVEGSRIGIQSSEVIETVETIGVNSDGFDPLQTIYPDSENENSSDSNESKSLHITINKIQNKKRDITLESKSTVALTDGNNITIQPPPQQSKPINILELDLEGINNEEAHKVVSENNSHTTNETNANITPSTPSGWVDFFDDNNDDESASMGVTPFKLDKDDVDKAFEIQWPLEDESNKGKPEPTYPEPPRPETPDPELDIPFHPFINTEDTWRLWLRYPEKKTRVKQISKYTTDRYWREVAVRLVEEHGRKVIALHEITENTDEISPEPYRTVRIEPYMQLSREKLQQYDKYGKLHVFKLNHVSYKELVGMRPEKFSIKNLQNLVSHKPKQNITLDHIPVYTEILKFGSLDQTRIRRLMPVFEDALMKIPSYKDTSLNYSREEVCCYVVDEYEGKLSVQGAILEQKARTRIFCTAFVNGGPHIVLGLNDKWRFGREVVRRCDILPVMHDEWISIRNPEFHSCVQMEEYEKDHMLQFYPLDGCRFELLRFRVSLRGNRELPMQVKVTYTIDGRRVSMRCDLLVPGYFSTSKRSGAVPCEKVEIHIPFPEEWIYHFRVEKHHKYGSVHSTLRKPGKIKGLERITQMAQSLLPPSMLEASIGVAKYEHLYKAIVWRIPRVPEKSEASFRPHLLTCNLVLAPHDTVPEWEALIPYCQIEYTMPSSTVSGATVRSISVEHTGNVEKFVKYLTKYKYTMDIDYQLGSRKEPALKSLLDEDTSNFYEKPSEQTQSNRTYEVNDSNYDSSDNNNGMKSMDNSRVEDTRTDNSNEMEMEQTAPTEFGDLLGLGDDFNTISDVRSEQSKQINMDNLF